MNIHQPCPDCGGSDCMTINDNKSTYCHSCTKYTRGEYDGQYDSSKQEKKDTNQVIIPDNAGVAPIPERGITSLTAGKYGVQKHGNETYFPYYDGEELCGAKVRGEGKSFYSRGDVKSAGLFGQTLFPSGSAKTITITEGEMDTLAVFQIQGSKYPVVSIKNGASGALKDCKAAYNYLEGFDEIVVNFDNDAPGQAAAAEVCSLFAGKCRNLVLSLYKDGNDYLINDSGDTYVHEWWTAPRYRPDDIVGSDSLLDEVLAPLSLPIARYPWDGINLLTYGIRKGELVTVVAGTGAGKSTFMKCVIEHVLETTEQRVGVVSLEETVQTAALSLMSISCNKPLHLPTKKQMQEHVLNDPVNIMRKPHLAEIITDEEKKEAYEQVLGTGRLTFYRSGGNMTVDSVLERVKYMTKVDDCPIIILDHISILVGMQQTKTYGNEREAIDECMHRLRCLVEETDCTILLVSHLSRGDSSGTPHEEGGRVKLNQLRGSQAIAQLSNIAIAIERNSQAETSEERSISTVRVLKNRFSGETGEACQLQWSQATGHLKELDKRLEEAL